MHRGHRASGRKRSGGHTSTGRSRRWPAATECATHGPKSCWCWRFRPSTPPAPRRRHKAGCCMEQKQSQSEYRRPTCSVQQQHTRCATTAARANVQDIPNEIDLLVGSLQNDINVHLLRCGRGLETNGHRGSVGGVAAVGEGAGHGVASEFDRPEGV